METIRTRSKGCPLNYKFLYGAGLHTKVVPEFLRASKDKSAGTYLSEDWGQILIRDFVGVVTRCLALKLDTIRDAKESMGLIFVLSFLD